MLKTAAAVNEARAHELRHTLQVASVDTALLVTVRAMSRDARRAWLHSASAAQIERLALCFAVEAGDATLVDEFAAKLTALAA